MGSLLTCIPISFSSKQFFLYLLLLAQTIPRNESNYSALSHLSVLLNVQLNAQLIVIILFHSVASEMHTS